MTRHPLRRSPRPQNTRTPTSTGVVSPRLVPILAVVLLAVTVASMMLAATLGSVGISAHDILETVASRVTGADSTTVPPHLQQIVWELRLPRVLLAAVVGAALSIAGVAVQGLVRNPIADPYVLGVSSGASVGAAFILLFGGFGGLGSTSVTAGAFVSGMIAMTIVYFLAQDNGRLEPLRLVLIGVVLSYVFSGVTSFLVFQGHPQASQEVMFWMLGSFGRARWSALLIPFFALLVVGTLLFLRARPLDAMLSGDETATTLGVHASRLRLELFLFTTALTAVMVASSGAVAFVGLVVPHLTRLVVGSLHRRLLPVAAVGGALFMVWVDLLARVLASPQEIPLGIITSLIGGPLFVALMRRQSRQARRI